MDRSGSVEDMVSGIWRLGASGMGRTDSEAAFQEFLKKIPSSSNLAAQAAAAQGGSLDAAQQLQLQQQALLQQQAQAQAYQDVANAQAGGIPRVPSLDLLRQQLQHLQSLQQLSMHNPNGDRAATNPIASQALRGSAGETPPPPPPPSAGLHTIRRSPARHFLRMVLYGVVFVDY